MEQKYALRNLSCSKTLSENSHPSHSEKPFITGSKLHPIFAIEITPVNEKISKLPIVMIHGGFHSGKAYLQTPDDRKAWSLLFAERGHCVIVPDWPAHGQSPGLEKIFQLSTHDVASSLGVLISDLGPCILMAHSAAGPIAWWLAENYPDLVHAIVGLAPGPPANILPALPDDPVAVEALRHDTAVGCPIYAHPTEAVHVDADFIKSFWANSPQFPISAFDQYAKTIGPESPRVLNERFNIGGSGLRIKDIELVRQRPILIVTGEQDLRHSKQVDAALAEYLGATHLWLPDKHVHQNGHMLMIELNSHDIAQLIMTWLSQQHL